MELFDPFDSLSFAPGQCFLSGRAADIQIPVFPLWLQEQFSLGSRPFKLLNEDMATFGNLYLPCNCDVNEKVFVPLESAVSESFSHGYEAVKVLPELVLFQWFSKLLYGLVYAELQIAFTDHTTGKHASSEPLGVSPSLITRFRNLHLLLQSLIVPMELEDFKPWSLVVQPIEEMERAVLDYRDDMITMIFTLAHGDTGIIMVLHDSGRNKQFHKQLLEKVEDRVLDQMQFRELAARFFYSAYLFQPIPHYLVLPPTKVSPWFSVSQQPLEGAGMRPVFNPWENKVYSQVLEEFWKPWGLKKSEILNQQGELLSFL